MRRIMKIRLAAILRTFSQEHGREKFVLVEDTCRRIRGLSKVFGEVSDAEKYGREVVRRFNRQHACEEDRENIL
jgi:hypothetical protein